MKRYFPYLSQKFKPKKLLDSVALVIIALVVFQLLAIGVIFSRMIYDIVEQQTEKRALQAAKHIALIPALQKITQGTLKLEALQSLAESIRLEAEATMVMVTDDQGVQISNTDRTQIGTRFATPEESRALRYGRPYLSKTDSLKGAVINGNAPIFNENLDIIGMVSVGYLVENVRQVTQGYLEKELLYIWVFITLGLAVAILIARGVKRATFGLEPQEIANLFQEREAIIASIREGIVATDIDGVVTMLNQTAREQLGETLLNEPITAMFPEINFSPVLNAGESILSREICRRGTEIIFNIVPIIHNGQIRGAVATLRHKDEIDLIAKELSQVQSYSDMLRAQTHEYNNRLHAIVGMVQMEAYDDVLDFIAEETTEDRLLIRFLTEAIPDSALSSFLIGKYMHASELKVEFKIDPESQMLDIPEHLNRHHLVTILGNVINNAFDAALAGQGQRSPRVELFMTDFGHDLIFEIADSGSGVPDDMLETIFNRGISTKGGEKRGYGLHLVNNTLKLLHGGISIQKAEIGGALFIIEIPKQVKQNEDN
ncbi:two-component system, CitB family, sensor kinase [Desulfuromusa kysingii]|uniref:Two-component system, CitB family, sensor kinase n=1 Tax=Desulfuromusa kysingii TaxID=37625 RepID=A0A1H4DX05_9BACT|nr:sensor histidine kinase [Desulfuromusa kysingii]SEA77304.1 two-component system, CitB family, sensor kinase [Desulfuromusa kysingii]